MITITVAIIALLLGIGVSVLMFKDDYHFSPVVVILAGSFITVMFLLFAGWLGFTMSTTTVSYTKVPNTVYTYKVKYTVHAFGEDVLTSAPECPDSVESMHGRNALKVGKDYYVKVIGDKDK